MKLIIRWVILSLSLFVAAWLIPGIHVEGGQAWVIYAIVAIILGLVNAIVRPLLKLLSCGLIMITLGLFTLVINAATFLLTSYIAVNFLHIGFYVDNFWSAFLGSIVVSIVTIFLSIFVKDDDKK